MKILVIDNYDSFVYNLVHILYNLGVNDIEIRKNDKIDIEEVNEFDKILLSPGPGIPSNAGIMPEIIRKYSATKSILGICLGHQAIAENFEGELNNLTTPLHGIASELSIIKEDYLFNNIPEKFKIGHYHSWVVNTPLPKDLEVLAYDKDGNVMALKHRQYDVRGVQFHPESVLTEHGIQIIKNWITNK